MRNPISLPLDVQKWMPVIALFLAFSSCGGNESESAVVAMEEPSDLIPEDKMILVLADVHMLESVIGYKVPMTNAHMNPFSVSGNIQTPPPVPQKDTTHKPLPYYDIFAKYGYTHDQYERSIEWYALDAQHYGEMYDQVINELTRRQAGLQGTNVAGADSAAD